MFTTDKISCNFHYDKIINDIHGLFIINIYVFKLMFLLLLVRMWPVSLWMGDLKTFHGIWEKTIHVYNWKDIM